jgi:hypothetical protein
MPENIDTIIAKYAKRTPKKPRKSLVVFFAVILVLVIALLVVGGLTLLKNKQTATTSPATAVNITAGPSAKEVVDKIATNEAIVGEKNYVIFRTSADQLNAIPDTTTLTYAHSGYDFLTNVAAEDGLRFTLNNTKATSDKAGITKTVESVLIAAGFSKATQDTSALTSYATTTYVSGGTVCQVIDFASGSKQSFLEQAVLCSSSASLEASYANVKALLTSADATTATSLKTVHQTIVADVQTGKIKLLTLTVLPKNSTDTTSYYYATLDTKYEYLGKRPTPSVDNEASYALSDQLKKNISDPKWGTFLTDTIK